MRSQDTTNRTLSLLQQQVPGHVEAEEPDVVQRAPISYLVPDLPTLAEISPFLQEIDENLWYSNAGPLSEHLLEGLRATFFSRARAQAGLVLTSSGTAALEVGLSAMRLPAGSMVGVPALTFPATLLAVLRAGHVPVILDVDPETWMLNPQQVRELKICKRLAAVIPVASYGLPVDAGAWSGFRAETGIKVLIDAAAALGNQPLAEGVHAAFSLHATKPFGIGEGGLLVTLDREVSDRARKLINFGFEGGVICQAGCNAKLSEYHAAVGLAQLRRWTMLHHKREKLLQHYADYARKLRLPFAFQPGSLHSSPASLVVRLTGMAVEDAQSRLKGVGVESRRLYLPTLEKHPAVQELGIAHFVAEGSHRALYDWLLALPFHTRVTEENVRQICEALRPQA